MKRSLKRGLPSLTANEFKKITQEINFKSASNESVHSIPPVEQIANLDLIPSVDKEDSQIKSKIWKYFIRAGIIVAIVLMIFGLIKVNHYFFVRFGFLFACIVTSIELFEFLIVFICGHRLQGSKQLKNKITISRSLTFFLVIIPPTDEYLGGVYHSTFQLIVNFIVAFIIPVILHILVEIVRTNEDYLK